MAASESSLEGLLSPSRPGNAVSPTLPALGQEMMDCTMDEDLICAENCESMNLSCSYESCPDETMYGSSTINDYHAIMRKDQNLKKMISHASEVHDRCFMVGEPKKREAVSKKCKDNSNSCISEEIYSKDLSEFKLAKEDSLQADLSLDTEFEMYRLQCNLYSNALQEKKGDEVGGVDMTENSKMLNYREKEHKIKPYEDMELAYHSNSSGGSTPNLPISSLEGIGILRPHTSKVMQMIDKIHKTTCNHVNFKDNTYASAFDSINVNGKAVLPATSLDGFKQSTDSVSLTGYKDLKYGNLGDQQVTTYVVLPDHATFVTEHVSRESSYILCPQTVSEHDPKNQQSMPDIPSVFSAAPLTLQMTEGKELCINTEGLNDNGILPTFEDHQGLQRQRPALIKSTVFALDNLEDSIPNVFEDSFHSIGSNNSSEDSQGENMFDFSFFVPGVSINEDQYPFQGVIDSEVAIDPPLEQVNCIDTDFKCLTCLNKRMVSQGVDASSDFRTYFTIDRTTSIEASVVSRGDNTEMTFFDNCSNRKLQPKNYRSVGCITDNSSRIMQEADSQTVWTDSSENLIVADLTTGDWKLSTKDSINVHNKGHGKDLKEETERTSELSKQDKKGHSLHHLQRAVKAELQLLHYHFWMCQQHCWNVYKHAMEEDCFYNRVCTGDKKEMGANLFTILAELEIKYNYMKEKLLSGTPLDALPPLSVESTVRPTIGSYIPSELMNMDTYSAGDRTEVGHLKDEGLQVSSTSENEPFPLVCSSDSYRPEQISSVSIKEGSSINQNEKKDSHNSGELNESWFDARENQMTMDISVTAQRKVKESSLQTVSSPAETKTLKSSLNEAKERFYVFVGSLCSSISEVDVRSYFQKYRVSEILIHKFSLKVSYAILAFKTANHAQLAVEEMDGKEVHGKAFKIHHIKVARKSVSSTFQILSDVPTNHQITFGKNAKRSSSAPCSPTMFSSSQEPLVEVTTSAFHFPATSFIQSSSMITRSTTVSSTSSVSAMGLFNAANTVLGLSSAAGSTPGLSNVAGGALASSNAISASSSPFKLGDSICTICKGYFSSSAFSTPITTASVGTSTILKPPGSKFDTVSYQETEGKPMQMQSLQVAANMSSSYIPQTIERQSSFKKLMRRLSELHPEANKAKLFETLVEVKESNNGFLKGLPLTTILERASALLRKHSTIPKTQ